jgi:hypothetical protein
MYDQIDMNNPIIQKDEKIEVLMIPTSPQFGIREYLTNSEQFSAIIKHRYSDFHVLEIDLLGKTSNLTSLTYTLPIANNPSSHSLVSDHPELLASDEDKCKNLAVIIDIPDVYESLMSLLTDQDPNIGHLEIIAPKEKEHRTNIHTFIRKNFQGRLGTR